MNRRTLSAALAAGMAVAPAAWGQMPQTQISIGPDVGDLSWSAVPKRPASLTRNILPMTTEGLARLKKMGMLTHEAEVSLHAGDYAAAEVQARQAIATDPIHSGITEEDLASALEAQGKDQEALEQYQRVVEHYDRQPRNLLPYALLLLKSGQWEQSLAVYNRVLPSLPDVGPHPEAITVHDRDAMQTNSRFSPDAPEPAALATALHIARGLVYNSMCDWAGEPQNKEAMAEYQKALQLAPNSGLANYYYGVGWQKLGPDERAKFGTAQQAKAALQKAVKFGRGDVKVAAQKALMVAMKPQ